MTTRRTTALLVSVFLSRSIAAGCGGGDGGGEVITADGSSTVGPFVTKAAEDFKAEQDVDITVGISGTGGGFERFCAGETDLSNASRRIDEEEAAMCEEAGIEYVEFRVATDALTNVVNTENDWATCLTIDQLKAIWEPGVEGDELESGRSVVPRCRAEAVRAWHGLGHVRLLHRRHQRRGGREQDGLLAERGRQRHRPGCLWRRRRARVLRILVLRAEPGHAQGTRGRRRRRLHRPECRRRHRTRPYTPLSRPLFVYAKQSSFDDNEDVQSFVQYMLDNNDSIATDSLFVPLSQEQIDEQLADVRGSYVVVPPPAVVIEQPGALALPRKKIRWGEQFVHLILFIAAAISVLTTLGIVLSLLMPAIDFFREVSPWEFFTGTTWAPLFLDARFGVVPLVVGTFVISFWSAVVAFPLGVGVAIYLSEYARPRATAFLKPILEILAAIPTVVLGYFALTFVTPFLRDIGLQVEIFNALSASLVLGIMLIPTVATLSEDAMAAVPRDLRDGGYALGADKLQVSTRIVVPAAISGIIAAFVLAFSRAVGETMIVLIAAGQLAQITFDPRETIETMTAFIGATGNGDVPTGSIEYKTIFAVGLTLFVITLVMNLISIRLVRKYREIYE